MHGQRYRHRKEIVARIMDVEFSASFLKGILPLAAIFLARATLSLLVRLNFRS